ncbi:cupin domain-containing protein [Limisalsivibrio acetivorans]|uniref:cupin domain-containing protein n=1 Tax=Limisalsivibrio acetivorans TaxID=1304888 RepID=UPI0003B3A281|nr:cupin domain-containing protein [Limisalsivibrio acetivorans]
MIIRVGDIDHKEVQNPKGGEGSVTQLLYDKAREFGGNIKLFAVMDLPPNSSVGYHEHADDTEFYLMLDGIGEVNDNGVTDMLHPGDLMITPKGESHSITNKTDNNLTFFALIVE